MLFLQEYSSITTTIIFDEEIRNSKMATNCFSTRSFLWAKELGRTKEKPIHSVRPYEAMITNQPVQRKRRMVTMIII